MPIAADPTPLGPHLTNTVDQTGKIVDSAMTLNPIFSGQAIHQQNIEDGKAEHIEGEQLPALMHMLNQDVPVLKEDAVSTGADTPEVTPVPHSTIEEKKVAATEATARVTADKPVTDGENDTVENDTVEKVEGEYKVEDKPLTSVEDVEPVDAEAPTPEEASTVAALERSFKSTLLNN